MQTGKKEALTDHINETMTNQVCMQRMIRPGER
jgi:hypothetical protein